MSEETHAAHPQPCVAPPATLRLENSTPSSGEDSCTAKQHRGTCSGGKTAPWYLLRWQNGARTRSSQLATQLSGSHLADTPHCRGEAGRIVEDITGCKTHHLPPAYRQLRIPAAIPHECPLITVIRAPINLEDQLELLERNIGNRRRCDGQVCLPSPHPSSSQSLVRNPLRRRPRPTRRSGQHFGPLPVARSPRDSPQRGLHVLKPNPTTQPGVHDRRSDDWDQINHRQRRTAHPNTIISTDQLNRYPSTCHPQPAPRV